MDETMHERSSMTQIRGRVREDIHFTYISFFIVLALTAVTHTRNMLWQDPIMLLEDTVRKSPLKVRVRYNLATRYEVQGYPDLSEKAYRALIDLDPDHVMAHNNLGNVYVSMGRFAEAARELQAAIKLDPNAPLSHDNLGYVYFQLGRFDEAVREYQAAMTLAPDNAEIHNNLGYAYYTQGRFEDAAEQYRIALKLKPDFPAALENAYLLDRASNRKQRQK